MSDVWEGGGHLTVQRDLDGNSNLVEVWELENLVWQGDDPGKYEMVKLWVADINDIPSGGVPYTDKAVSGVCEFSEAPEEVRESFINQAIRLRDAMFELEHGADDDE